MNIIDYISTFCKKKKNDNSCNLSKIKVET